MRTLHALLAAFLVVALFPLADAEAKRLGGGMNLGKQYQSMPRQATPPRQAQQPPAAGQRAAPAASGASRWLGPLAGLAAGGLLASLFFGDAFEGLQIFDILLFAALIGGGFLLFRAMRRNAAGPAPAAAGAYGGMPYTAGPGGMPGSMGETAGLSAEGRDEAPVWFDGPAFAEGAKTHFIRLQAAWDQSDFRDIREYTAPQLFAELQRERERLGTSPQFTEVVRLDAELLGVRRDGDLAVASVAFSGLIREEEDAPATAFREIWHVQHAWATREGDWLISGIQQVEE